MAVVHAMRKAREPYLPESALQYDSTPAWPCRARPNISPLAAHDRHVPRVVARRFLLFVGRLVLLVHDDQPEVFYRSEQRRARADHDPRLALVNAMPLVVPLAFAQTAVQNGDQSLAKRPRKRSSVWGVSEISGTSTIAPLPLSIAY